jgi:hypothetical protein
MFDCLDADEQAALGAALDKVISAMSQRE